ncbi:MAG: FAD-dependent oxidoreductase [Eubacteriales bacterium]
MARALLADPYLPTKVMENREEEVIHCLRCFACMAERPTTQTRRCTVNPLIGREWQGLELTPARTAKDVLVAGGGVGGLYTALIAARRGHHVTLCEQSDKLGGILNCEQAVSFKYDMYRLGVTLETLLHKEKVEILLNTKVTPELLKTKNPQALILAVGSSPIIPPIDGIQGKNIVVVNDYYKNVDLVGKKVVVLGGGLAGCECAIHLGQEGKEVTLLEMRAELAPDCNIRNRPILLKQVAQYLTALPSHRALSIDENGVTCLNEQGEQITIQADTVICATGQRSNRDDVSLLRDGAPFVREIGDCVRPATIMQAIYQGYHAALDI